MEQPPIPEANAIRSLIEGGARILSAAIPGVGSVIVQGYTEYVSARREQRAQEFFEFVVGELKKLEQRQEELAKNLSEMPDAAEILERAVEAATKETAAEKRPMYSKAYLNFITAPGDTQPEDRVSIISEIEQLTFNDLEVLARFGARNPLRGDELTGTTHPDYGAMVAPPGFGGAARARPDWRQQHGPLISSLQRLQARGLLSEVHINRGSSTPGGEDPQFTTFRMRGWQATALALRLVGAIR
ncbi:hypothetical protein [Luteolibacter soli]|uniref:DUF4393 domain-containing protein n=1 Tax=Luteolibacter soli TaxID=3135280 RepID=A0ABU9B4N5_9BACT